MFILVFSDKCIKEVFEVLFLGRIWNKKIFFLLIVLICLVYVPVTYAFGLSLPFYEEDVIPLEIDQSFLYIVTLQNGDDFDIDLNFEYDSDSDVAKLRKKDFFLPAKTYDKKLYFDINLPNSSLPGDVFVLTMSATPKETNESGQVPMVVQLKRSVKFVMVEDGGVGVSKVKYSWIQKAAFGIWGVIKRIYLCVLGVLLLALIAFTVNRLWGRAKLFVNRLFSKKNSSFGVKDMISKAKSVEDVKVLLRMLPQKEFDSIALRQLLSRKLESLGMKKAGRDAIFVKSKSDMLKKLSGRRK